MIVLSLISVLQSVQREFQSRVQTELAEAQQQLRQKVSVKSHLVTSEIFLMSLFLAVGGTATIQ